MEPDKVTKCHIFCSLLAKNHSYFRKPNTKKEEKIGLTNAKTTKKPILKSVINNISKKYKHKYTLCRGKK